jgi:hypothetical protein
LTDLNKRRFGAEFSNNQEKGRFRKEVENVEKVRKIRRWV